MSEKKEAISIVPEPKKLEFSGNWLKFNGFQNFDEFLSNEFKVPKGDWKINKVSKAGTGLEVLNGEIKIWGDENVCYATIIQLLKQNPGYVPEVKVEEEFKFSFRGYHLDIARGGVPKVETFKKLLRWLFLLKYNYFAIYFEDLFPWRKYPQIGIHRGRLSDEELNEIINYGKKLGIDVFPSLELAGHMEHILSLPEFWEYSEWHNPREGCLDVSNEKAREFAYDLLKEVVERSPSKYIHIGGDETWAMGRGRSLNKTWQFEGPKLYELHHRNMVDIVKEKGKVPLLWGDMLTGMYLREEKEKSKWSEIVESKIWEGVIIANWDYSPSDEEYFRNKINLFGKRKSQQIACPGLANWNRYYPNFDVALENVKNFITAAKKENLPGFLLTAWGDDGEECMFSFLDPLLLATIEIAEGNGKWEEKWLTLTKESREVLEVRKLFGKPEVSDRLKHVLFADFWYYRMNENDLKTLKSSWDEILSKSCYVNLPEDLEFIRSCIEVGQKRLNNCETPSDFIALANKYSKLWLSERKPHGLERILERFWGAAGRIDAGVK
ncbi:MAG: beta-N-acetylhexosaminidase [Thermoproteota archaeon]|nr:beta-N-acetylhexosaminidase [Candidatus Brockarchaeota archaeon]MBO3801076.1 beta-N-acetylhexosaminidase [Candidatus Brockarchaeota archaeon]